MIWGLTHKERGGGPCDAACSCEVGGVPQHTQFLPPDGHDDPLEGDFPGVQFDDLAQLKGRERSHSVVHSSGWGGGGDLCAMVELWKGGSSTC